MFDVTGKKFGCYTVIERGEDLITPKGLIRVRWRVRCTCGNEKLVQSYKLRNADYVYCEMCRPKQKEVKNDIVGKTFGKLLVVKRLENRTQPNGATKLVYACTCACGTKNVAVDYSHLTSGHTQSCGCNRSESLSELRSKDMLGVRSGKLVVDSFHSNESGCNYWFCRCDCSGTKVVSTSDITTGHVQSCGCLNSKAELELGQYLSANGIECKQWFKFDDCLHKTYLYFDFAVFYKGDLLFLVELHGQQHYYPYTFCGESKEQKALNLARLQERDAIKRDYCKENGIDLLEIRYTKFKKKERIVQDMYSHLCSRVDGER